MTATTGASHDALQNPSYHQQVTPVAQAASANGAAATDSRARADAAIRWLRDYTETRLNSRVMDERRTVPPYVVLDLGNEGLLGMQVPQAYGGMGLGNGDTLRVFQQLGAIDLSLATMLIVNDILGSRPLIHYSTPEVRSALLPRIAAGRELTAFAYTEPRAGSNIRGIGTWAVADGKGGWRISGKKIWIGLASWAGVINVFAQLYDEQHNPLGISGFAVRQGTPGLSHGPEAMTTGMRAMVQNSVYLDEVHVGPESLLGAPGQGIETVVLDATMYTRLVMGAVSIGGTKRALQLMHRYATRRTISTGRLLDNPHSLLRLSELTAATAAAEALITMTGALLDAGFDVPEEAFVACKTAAPELMGQAVDALVQMLGGRGYLETNIAPQLMRDARIFRIFEGPTETLNMYLGSRVINRRERIDRLLREGLQAPLIAENLSAAAEQVRARSRMSSAPFEPSVATRWAHIVTGEMATTALLAAAAQYLARQSGSEQMERAARWATLTFEQQWQRALAGSAIAERVLNDADALTELVSSYAETIGDLEQSLPGEESELDSVLRREEGEESAPSAPATLDAALSEPLAPAPQPVAPTPAAQPLIDRQDEIVQWLTEWLSRELRLSAGAIDVDHSFADYGLDSVTAVEMVMSLGEWFGQTLEATIVWNFPSIRALAAHLVHMLTPPDRAVSSEPTAPKTPAAPEVALDGLDELSDDELASLLAAELGSANGHNHT